MKLWLTLFNAETEEDLAKIEAMEVPVMKEAIGAYRQVASTGEFREIERLRSRARHNEASALSHARDEGKAEGKIEGIVEGKIESVMTFLEIRFGKIPAPLQQKLQNVRDDGRAESLLKQAATCQSLKEFQDVL